MQARVGELFSTAQP